MVSVGYVRGETILGAPYDFRFAPHSLTSYFEDLKDLIATAYLRQDRQRVIVVSHSMGGLYAQYFLRKQTTEWKAKYIRALVSISAPWSGSTLMAQAYASGFTFDIPRFFLDPLAIRHQQRTAEPAPLLLPSRPAWNDHDVIVSTPTRNYTIDDYDAFFEHIGFPVAKSLMRNVQTSDYELTHPDVDFYCWFGTGACVNQKNTRHVLPKYTFDQITSTFAWF